MLVEPNPSDRCERLFHAALDLDSEARRQMLEAECAGDPALLREIESLLEAHGRLDRDFLEPPGEPDHSGRRLGEFQLLRRIGAGAMGTVYEAEQDQPRRRVALKVLRAGILDDEARRRFRAEAEMLAGLEHPAIAHVYGAGEDDGLAYFTMEYVADSRTLLSYARGLSEPQRLALFTRVCDAIHHAHQRGIIHRDLKPSNILVRDTGPKIIDFGIAARNGSRSSGDVAGTLAFMSPEQRDPAAGVDVRTDVYALGVVLCRLLSREDERGEGTTPADRALVDAAPPGLPRAAADLRAIIAKATAPDRAHRYDSAAALAHDVRRYMRCEPVAARPASLGHQLRLFARRRPAVVALLCLIAIVLVVAGTAIVQFGLEAHRARAAAERQAYIASIHAAAAALRTHAAGDARLHLERAPAHLRGWEWSHLAKRTDASERVVEWPGAFVHAGAAAAAAPVVAIVAGSPASVRVCGLDGTRMLEVPRSLPGPAAYCCALSPDGRRLVVGYSTGLVEVRELPSGRVLHAGPEDARGSARGAAFAPDGRRFATVADDGKVRVWSRDGELMQQWLGHQGGAYAVAFTHGNRLATGGSADRTIRIWDLATREEVARAVGHEGNVEALAFSPDDRFVLSGSWDRTVRLWDAGTGRCVATMRGHEHGVKSVAFAPDGATFASASVDQTVRLWSARAHVQAALLVGHAAQVRSVAYVASGRELASFSRDGTVRFWDVDDLGGDQRLRAPERQPAALAITNRLELAVAGTHGRVATWDLATGQPIALFPSDPRQLRTACAFAAAADRCFLETEQCGVSAYRLSDGAKVADYGPFEAAAQLQSLSTTPDGDVLAVVSPHRVVVLQPATGATIGSWQVAGDAKHGAALVSIDAGGGRIAVARNKRGHVQIFTPEGKPVARLVSDASGARSLAFDPAGRTLAVGRSDGTIELWDTARGTLLRRLAGHVQVVTALAFSPDGTRLASAAGPMVGIWDPRWEQQILVMPGNATYTLQVAWSPDGACLAAAGLDADQRPAVRRWRAK